MTNNKAPEPGLNGNYDFNVKEVLSRALKRSSKNNWLIAQALLVIVAISVAMYLVFIDAFGITDLSLLAQGENPLTLQQQIIMELTLTSILAPLWAGVSMLAIRSNRLESTKLTEIFTHYREILVLSLASLLVSVLFTFGLSLYVIPGFYIFTATTFTLPLMTDKKLKPFAAIVASIRMTNIFLGKMLMIYALFLLLMLLVLASFGVAYLWVGPFYFNVKAILYQDLFCGDVKTQQDSSTDSGVFDA